MTPEETLDWLAQQHFDQCREERPIQDWIRKMKSQLPAQPEQEPHGYLYKTGKFYHEVEGCNPKKDKRYLPLYTIPPTQQSCSQRTWIGLTPQERDEINEQVYGAVPHHVAFHVAIEAKLKEKNT